MADDAPLGGELSTGPLRLALMGSRGIPAAYGGYETLMEEIATRLVDAGHAVTVFCRSHYTPRALRRHRGVDLVVLPTLRTKHLDTPVHTLLSCLHAAAGQLRGRRYDAALMVNGANALFVPILRLARVPTALHVDGIEKQRAKWGRFGRLIYALSERLACVVPSVLLTDAAVIRDHYEARYGAGSEMITYGVDPRPADDAASVLDRLGLTPRGYVLYVSRFEPENNPHRVIEGFRAADPTRGGARPIVLVGGAPYADDFVRGLERAAHDDPRIQLPGPIYGDGYRALQQHAWAYVQATEVGGTHPALVEGMGYGNALLVNGTPENREVAGDAAVYFDAQRPDTLGRALDALADDPARVKALRSAAAARARAHYSWDAVTDRYAALFARMARA
ncbi:MAG: glycosyltransferase [Acidobacteriota bacterium]